MTSAKWKGPSVQKRLGLFSWLALDPVQPTGYFCGFDSGAGFDGSSAFGEVGPK